MRYAAFAARFATKHAQDNTLLPKHDTQIEAEIYGA